MALILVNNACEIVSFTYAYNNTTIGEVMLNTSLNTLMILVAVVILNKTIEVIINLLSDRDFFKSGHLQFVHNLKEGLIIMQDRLKTIKLINVAARQML